MSAIDFVVRGDTGALTRGSLGGNGANSVFVTAGEDISLNLSQANILSYSRDGQALQVMLVDGTVLTLVGFFGGDGAPVADLYVSANGALSQVNLTGGPDAALLVQYVPADSFGKWSPEDDLYFVQDNSVVAPSLAPVAAPIASGGLTSGLFDALPLIGGLAALGGLALLNGGDGDDATAGGVAGDSGSSDDGDDGLIGGAGDDALPVGPTVAFTSGTQGNNHTFNAEDHSDGLEIGGTGTPGAEGTLTIGGVTKPISIGEDGTWSVILTPQEVPGGEFEQDISITVSNGDGEVTATDTLVLDTEVSVTLDTASVETDGVVNFVEESDGVTLTGTVDADADVTVSFGGNSYTAVVSGETWTLDVPAGVIPAGEFDLAITVDAVDAVGNTASTSGTLRIDTQTSLTLDDSAGGADGVVNAQEIPNGVEMRGLAEADATVVVTLGDVSKTVTANADGTWSAVYTSAELPTGELTLPVTAISTDLAGNTATASGSVTIDTEISITIDSTDGGADGVINFVERADGVTLTGTTEANATVDVVLDGNVQTVTADATGAWTADYNSAVLPAAGEGAVNVSATATDAAGNTATTQTTVDFDTFVNRLDFAPGDIEGDQVINNAEAADGVTLNGVVEAGSSVVVTFGGAVQAATVSDSGEWSVTYTGAQVASIAAGQADAFEADIVVDATDAAGNTASISETVTVDLVAPDTPNIEAVTRVAEGVSETRLNVTLEEGAEFHQFVDGASEAVEVDVIDSFARGADESQYEFANASVVPDGSHLIVNTFDDAGNSNATLLTLEESANNSPDLQSGALDDFNIGAIDLDFTSGSDLTLTADDLRALSQNDNELIIHGGTDDVVRLDELVGVDAADQQIIDGKTYDVYNLGDDTSLIIDETIQLNPIV